MSKSLWDEKTTIVVLRESHPLILQKGRRAPPQINRYIPHDSSHTGHNLDFGLWGKLKMHTSHSALNSRMAMVYLRDFSSLKQRAQRFAAKDSFKATAII
jgi:hypothetical protein